MTTEGNSALLLFKVRVYNNYKFLWKDKEKQMNFKKLALHSLLISTTIFANSSSENTEGINLGNTVIYSSTGLDVYKRQSRYHPYSCCIPHKHVLYPLFFKKLAKCFSGL